MKIRSLADLQTAMNEDFVWRRQELTTALFAVQRTNGRASNFSIRSAILLLYAHWEGYIKNASSYYLGYVSFQGLRYQELANCFVATALKQQLLDFSATLKATQHLTFVNYLDVYGSEVPKFNPDLIIKTGSNLNSSILKEILTVIGITYTPYELKGHLIDEQLLNYRNSIAHGEWLAIDQSGYEFLHHEIYAMLMQIKNEIENSAAQKLYKKQE